MLSQSIALLVMIAAIEPELGRPFDVKPSEVVTIRGLRITVERAAGNSRDPTGVRTRAQSRAEELAGALVAAANDADRTALLRNEQESVTPALVQALVTRGNQLFVQGEYSQAAVAYGLAQRIATDISDETGLAKALRNIGNIHYMEANFVQALDYYQQSLTKSEALGDKSLIAGALGNIGNVHSRRGDYAQMWEYYRRTLEIEEALGDKPGIAQSLHNMGLAHNLQGNYVEGLEYSLRSLEMQQGIGDQSGTAFALSNVGSVYLAQGDFARALDHYQRSRAMFEPLRNRDGIVRAVFNIGHVHFRQGNDAQALEHFQRSMQLFVELGDQDGVARSLDAIGSVYSREGRYAEALDSLRQALAKRQGLGDKRGIMGSLVNIGELYARQGDYTNASAYADSASRMSSDLDGKEDIVRTQILVATINQQQRRYTEALAAAEHAAAVAQQIGSLDALASAKLIVGTAYRALEQPANARLAFEEAISAVESMRLQVAGGEQDEQTFFELNVSPYQAMAELLVGDGRPAEALTYAERARARVLLDVLASGRVNITKAMTRGERERERELNGQLVSLNTQIVRENLRPQPDRRRLAELQSRLRGARLDLEAFRTNLYAAHPELRVERADIQPLRPDNADSLLADDRTALLEFLLGEERSLLFVLTRQTTIDLEVYTLPIGRRDLGDRVGRFRQMLAGLDNRFSRPARELYELLIAPAAAQLRGKTRLVIVPDGPLWELPFHALLSERDRYLIDDRSVFYVPSLTVLQEMRQLARRDRSREADATLLALGNPALGQETVRRVEAVLMDEKLEALPEAERQVRTLSRMYGRARSRVYVGADAREDRFKSEAGAFRILHLATHGILNDRSPMYSNLVFAQPRDADAEDGLLEARELMNLDLSAELAVLSACETARGRIGRGEGLIGLTWALFVAGVPRTVVSQWKVRSDSTADLMIEFHRRLLEQRARPSGRRDVAEALRGAALSIKRDPRYRHPFHWAPFVLIGDGQ